MNPTLLEWIGYIASALIAISLSTKSIIRLRWLNLIGAAIFAVYGLLIGALPIFFMNLFISIMDIYYLFDIYSKKANIELIRVDSNNLYFNKLAEYYKDDILKYFPNFTETHFVDSKNYIVMRNATIAGLFCYRNSKPKQVEVVLDYVLREYRDFKNGKFVYEEISEELKESGHSGFVVFSPGKKHLKYLKKMNFIRTNGNEYFKAIN